MNDRAKIRKLIEEAEAITIWGHGLPDGDCYGCQMGLKNLIKGNFPNKRVYAIGSGLPAFFPMMGAMDDPTDEEIKASLGILVDVSCLRRVEDQRVPESWVGGFSLSLPSRAGTGVVRRGYS